MVAHCEKGREEQCGMLLRAMASVASRGAVFREGETFSLGGMVFSFNKERDALVVVRPVIGGQSILGEDKNLSPLLLIVGRQIEFARQLGLMPETCELLDKVVVEKGCLEKSRIWLQRTADVADGDSGWFVSTESADGGQALEALWGWQLIQKRPEFADVLALPPGCAVAFEGAEIKLVLGPDGRRLAGRDTLA